VCGQINFIWGYVQVNILQKGERRMSSKLKDDELT
jgi:hypothetical protein